MKEYELLLIGGSAGSLEVILSMVTEMGKSYSLPVLIVLHRNPGFESTLADLFSHRANVVIREVEEKDAIIRGQIYLCPADYHVLIEQDHTFSLDYSERVNYSRPSIDVSFISASEAYGAGVIAVLLSGGNADGAQGMQEVKARGGLTIVQDPHTADVPYMPQQVLQNMDADLVVPAGELPALIRELGYR